MSSARVSLLLSSRSEQSFARKTQHSWQDRMDGDSRCGQNTVIFYCCGIGVKFRKKWHVVNMTLHSMCRNILTWQIFTIQAAETYLMILKVVSWLVSEWPRQLKQEINIKHMKNWCFIQQRERPRIRDCQDSRLRLMGFCYSSRPATVSKQLQE